MIDSRIAARTRRPRPGRCRAAGRRSRRGCPSPARSRRRARRRSGDDVGQQRVARRDAQAARGPGAGAQDGDLPGRRGDADQAGQHRRGGVAADRGRPAPVRVVGERTAAEPRRARQAVGDALDHPSAAAGAPRVLVRKLGSSEVGTSWPRSARRLAAPMPRTEGPNPLLASGAASAAGGCGSAPEETPRQYVLGRAVLGLGGLGVRPAGGPRLTPGTGGGVAGGQRRLAGVEDA